MPWTKRDYPVSMKNLPGEVRNKAIEIANALLEEKNMDERIAIATLPVVQKSGQLITVSNQKCLRVHPKN